MTNRRKFDVGALLVFDLDQPTENARKFTQRLEGEYGRVYPLRVHEIHLQTGRIVSLKGRNGETVYSSGPNRNHTSFDTRWLKPYVPAPEPVQRKWWQAIWDIFLALFKGAYWGFSR